MQTTFAADYLEEVKTDDDPTFSTCDWGDSDTGSSGSDPADEDTFSRAWV